MKCDSYRTEANWLGKTGVCYGTKEREPCDCMGLTQYCDFYPENRTKSYTNADKVRDMSDMELSEWFWWMLDYTRGYTDSKLALIDWLKQED